MIPKKGHPSRDFYAYLSEHGHCYASKEWVADNKIISFRDAWMKTNRADWMMASLQAINMEYFRWANYYLNHIYQTYKGDITLFKIHRAEQWMRKSNDTDRRRCAYVTRGICEVKKGNKILPETYQRYECMAEWLRLYVPCPHLTDQLPKKG